jgi:hypothetical protein
MLMGDCLTSARIVLIVHRSLGKTKPAKGGFMVGNAELVILYGGVATV